MHLLTSIHTDPFSQSCRTSLPLFLGMGSSATRSPLLYEVIALGIPIILHQKRKQKIFDHIWVSFTPPFWGFLVSLAPSKFNRPTRTTEHF